MRWDKTLASILLIFSITNVALAAPAIRVRHLDVASATPEKRAGSDNEATDGSESMPALVSDSDESRHLSDFESPDDLQPGSPSGSSHDSLQGWPPTSPAASFHEGGAPYLYHPPMEAVWWSHGAADSASYHDSVPSSPSGSSHYESASESLSSSADYDSAHDSLLSPSGSTGSLQEGDGTYDRCIYPEVWWRFDHVSPSSHGSAPEGSSGSGSSLCDFADESSTGSMTHSDSVGSMPELVSDSDEENSPEPVSDSSRNLAVPTTTHDDSAPESADQSAHHDLAPVTSDPSSHLESVMSAALHEAESSETEADKLFNDEMKPKRRDYAILGTVDGISTGPINGVRKEIRDTVYPGKYVSAPFAPSSSNIYIRKTLPR